MKKIILILFLFIPIVYAGVDFYVLPSLDSENMTAVIDPTGINDPGLYSGYLTNEDVTVTQINNPSGGGSYVYSTIYYDLIVTLDKDIYTKGDFIYANITIINKGYIPDMDGILTTYLKDPKGNISRNATKVYQLIPPTCVYGIYDQYLDCCKISGKCHPTNKYSEILKLSFPTGGLYGEWQLYAEYESSVQPLITAHAPLELSRWYKVNATAMVFGFIFLATVCLFIGAMIFFYISRRNKNAN